MIYCRSLGFIPAWARRVQKVWRMVWGVMFTITYFQPDERKAGGKYVSAVGTVKKVDDFERRITMQDGSKIPMDDVLIIDGEIFSSLE